MLTLPAKTEIPEKIPAVVVDPLLVEKAILETEFP
jgi:hypothetical protein